MDVQTLEIISNIGEIIAAILVVISLIYVGLQVRQNTHTLKVTTAQAQMEGTKNGSNNFVQSPSLAPIWAKGLSGCSRGLGTAAALVQ